MSADLILDHAIEMITIRFPGLVRGLIRTKVCMRKQLATEREAGMTLGLSCGCPQCEGDTSFWKRVEELADHISEDPVLWSNIVRVKMAKNNPPDQSRSTAPGERAAPRPPSHPPLNGSGQTQGSQCALGGQRARRSSARALGRRKRR